MMSVSTFVSENNPTSVTLGTVTYDNIVALGIKVQAANGTDAVTPRTVANLHTPQGYTDHPKFTQVSITIDHPDVVQNLILGSFWNPSGSNAALGTFRYREANNKGQYRTVTFDGANSRVQRVENKLTNYTTPVVEVVIATYGAISFSSWA